MIRIDKITVTMEVYVEFAGSHSVAFEYVPEPGDELARLLSEKSRELSLIAAKTNPATAKDLFG